MLHIPIEHADDVNKLFVIRHFTVMDGSDGEGDLVLIQTFFALLGKLFLKNTSKHKNNLIYIIMREGLYQNKLTLSLASIHNCKMAYSSSCCELSNPESPECIHNSAIYNEAFTVCFIRKFKRKRLNLLTDSKEKR